MSNSSDAGASPFEQVAKTPTARQAAAHLYANGMACNCDLDNWQPEKSTGHSWVCRIHKAAIAKAQP